MLDDNTADRNLLVSISVKGDTSFAKKREQLLIYR